MSKILLVFGATGQQGSSVIESVLNDSQLSKEYSIRAATRDATKPTARELAKKGVEVVSADVTDPSSLKKAFSGVHSVFATTFTIYDGKTKEHEIEHGRALAHAAVDAGVEFYIYCTLPHAEKISGGKIRLMGHFDGKQEVEEYIRTLPLKSTFFSPGSFMSNFNDNMRPQPVGDGTYALSNFVDPHTKIPLIDTADDTGKCIAAMLANPDKYSGQIFSCATDCYSMTEIADVMSKSFGKTVRYNQLPKDLWKSFLPAEMREFITEMFQFFEEFGYYGPGTEEKVAWTAKQARGDLTSLHMYFARNPLNLE